jgi:hypothetical protein
METLLIIWRCETTIDQFRLLGFGMFKEFQEEIPLFLIIYVNNWSVLNAHVYYRSAERSGRDKAWICSHFSSPR